MLDNGSFNYYGGTETETEQEQAQSAVYGYNYEPQETAVQDTSTYDDYTMQQNYDEQSYYEPSTSTDFESGAEESGNEQTVRGIQLHDIQREQVEVVNLIKTKQKLALTPRMKIVATVFSIVTFALLFLIIFNFASLGSINSTIAERQTTVNELNLRINELKTQYNELSDDNNFIQEAEQRDYVFPDESNTYYVDSSQFYNEESIEKLPSNWFNDFCNFLSGLFN